MRGLLSKRVTWVWLALIAATLISFRLVTDHPTGAASVSVGVAIAVGFVKVRYVGLEFMELRSAPRALRRAFEAWVLVVGTTLVVLLV